MPRTLGPGHSALVFNVANHGRFGMHASLTLSPGRRARGRVPGTGNRADGEPRRPPSRAAASDPLVERGGDLIEVNAA